MPPAHQRHQCEASTREIAHQMRRNVRRSEEQEDEVTLMQFGPVMLDSGHTPSSVETKVINLYAWGQDYIEVPLEEHLSMVESIASKWGIDAADIVDLHEVLEPPMFLQVPGELVFVMEMKGDAQKRLFEVTVVFGNFSGWIRKLVFGNFPVGFGNCSGWIRKLFPLYLETSVFWQLVFGNCPVGFGNFPIGFGNFRLYYKVLLQYYSVLLHYYKVLIRTTLYYKVLLQYYSVLLQYYSVLLHYYKVLLHYWQALCFVGNSNGVKLCSSGVVQSSTGVVQSSTGVVLCSTE